MTLDTEYISQQVKDALAIEDWSTVKCVYISGSFANPEKDIDKDGNTSDIDIEIVTPDVQAFEDAQKSICYDGRNPATLHVTGNQEDYGKREMDFIHRIDVDSSVSKVFLPIGES